ncbi:NUDIX domain-containing protein [Paenibacillus koleovorans]|uniref:NUDIX domain-containing protein n=1 Tax=Paenibacillus koleovorans TaxID=121608 RepID=UPI000FD90948|nr:8-oxo-dGTP diphosphatase [Paenibacillus koleovorans]
MVLALDGERVLLVNRPSKLGFPGYIGPGGKVGKLETITDAAVRELLEETGLRAEPSDLIYKGMDGFVDPTTEYRYIVFNYVVRKFEGELLLNPPEGELVWVPVAEALDLPMQDWFKRRFPLFFAEGTFEMFDLWELEAKRSHGERRIRLGGAEELGL